MAKQSLTGVHCYLWPGWYEEIVSAPSFDTDDPPRCREMIQSQTYQKGDAKWNTQLCVLSFSFTSFNSVTRAKGMIYHLEDLYVRANRGSCDWHGDNSRLSPPTSRLDLLPGNLFFGIKQVWLHLPEPNCISNTNTVVVFFLPFGLES